MTDQVNIPLLRKAVEWAEAEAAKPKDRRAWDQLQWVWTPEEYVRHEVGIASDDPEYAEAVEQRRTECGTAYCIAGYVAVEVGGGEFESEFDADDRHVAEVAAEALGIEPPRSPVLPESGHLFYGMNTIEDVRRIAEEIAGERL